ncbi:MAG: cytochrome c class [Planctomycetaceae bacterium]|nr:cytochrome c class [Planctomycetaceae bacterium]
MSLTPQVPLAALFVAALINLTLLRAEDASKPSEALTFPLSQRAKELIPEVQQKVMKKVEEQFGTPSHPIVPEGIPVEKTVVLKGQTVYSLHCARCHGEAGTGAGPEAKALQPQPRDFRRGVFKWKSTSIAQRPLRHDLRETIRLGVPDTAMPGFPKFSEADAKSVVEYVRWLSMAGEFQVRLVDEFYSDFSIAMLKNEIREGKKEKEVIANAIKVIVEILPEVSTDSLKRISDDWKSAELETSILRPKSALASTSDAAVQRGRELFTSLKVRCNLCHGETGKGDGIVTRDFWPIPGDSLNRKYAEPGLHNVWGQVNQPWDLAKGKMRGGDSPEDLFRRIAAGISGTQMPGFGGSFLTEAEIWDVVSYVQSLPSEKPKTKSIRQPPPQGATAK